MSSKELLSHSYLEYISEPVHSPLYLSKDTGSVLQLLPEHFLTKVYVFLLKWQISVFSVYSSDWKYELLWGLYSQLKLSDQKHQKQKIHFCHIKFQSQMSLLWISIRFSDQIFWHYKKIQTVFWTRAFFFMSQLNLENKIRKYDVF